MDIEVDSAVNGTTGCMSTLSCPEEVFLAEKLIEINNWAIQKEQSWRGSKCISY